MNSTHQFSGQHNTSQSLKEKKKNSTFLIIGNRIFSMSEYCTRDTHASPLQQNKMQKVNVDSLEGSWSSWLLFPYFPSMQTKGRSYHIQQKTSFTVLDVHREHKPPPKPTTCSRLWKLVTVENWRQKCVLKIEREKEKGG